MESSICGHIQYLIHQIMAFKKYMLKEKVGEKNGGRRKAHPPPLSSSRINHPEISFSECTGDKCLTQNRLCNHWYALRWEKSYSCPNILSVQFMIPQSNVEAPGWMYRKRPPISCIGTESTLLEILVHLGSIEGAFHLPPPQLLQGFGWGKKIPALPCILVQHIFINTHLYFSS